MEGRLMTTCCRCMTLLRNHGHTAAFSQSLILKRHYNQTRKNHYEILRLSKNASSEDIKDAFVKLSKETHPDVNKHDPKTSERFSEIIEAYRILSKPSLREEYDLQHMWNRRHVHNIYPPRSYHQQDRNPGDDDFEIMYKRANEFHRRQHMKENQRIDNSKVILYLFGVVAFGGFLAYGTIQFHYHNRKYDTDNFYRKNQATYREEQALRLANGKIHKDKVMKKLRNEADQKRRELEEEMGVTVTPSSAS